jgi:D-ribulokinase
MSSNINDAFSESILTKSINNESIKDSYLIGIDVGTGSARAGVFDVRGRMLASAKTDITLYTESGLIVEQSSNEIWAAVTQSVRKVLEQTQLKSNNVVGIGFDATCSLVVLGENGQPLPVGPTEDANRNIIVWMDHRAIDQADRINAIGHDVLKYVGGKISPEMQTPKLLWLLENKPAVFNSASHFMDLADFLTWRATDSLDRSTCTLTCKWTYLGKDRRWDPSYFQQVGLGILADEKFCRIGTNVIDPGNAVGDGLSHKAAQELGLNTGIAVSAGLIDAHAGGVGTVGAGFDILGSLAYVFGTSSCTMTTTTEPVFVPGVWGPYYSAMIPDVWLLEGGQSAAGAGIDQLICSHPAYHEFHAIAAAANISLPDWLADRARQKVNDLSSAVLLAKSIHVVPEYLGNRAPFADPQARALIAGLGMERDEASIIALYISGICAIGYGLKQILNAQALKGAQIQRVMISGGAGEHELIRQLLADATGRPVFSTQAAEPVLLGSAIIAGVAAKVFPDMRAAMKQMSRIETEYLPSNHANVSQHHNDRFKVFERLQSVAREINN